MPAEASATATILVVDDDQGMLRLISRSLQQEGFVIITVASGKEAITWLNTQSADLILLDLKLFDMTGQQIVDELKANHLEIPFIIITGHGDERIAVDMMKRGATDYLIKDGHFLELIPKVVRRALKERDREKQLLATEIERKRLEQEILDISKYERQRIGQDLHDGLCQELAGIEFLTQLLTEKLSVKSNTEAARANKIAELIRQAILHTRDLARGLSPVVLESEGLMSALEQLTHHTEKLFRIKCHFQCNQPVLVENNTTATHLYRIAQEAISNAIKHGKAKKINLLLESDKKGLILSIHDNGIGINQNSESKGMGLRIMNFRAGVIGAALSVEKAKVGTMVRCCLHQISENL